MIFDFSTEVISRIINELQLTERYIRIAMFQIHHDAVFRVLNEKIKQGIKVDILTLPYDSINENIRPDVEQKFEEIKESGATIHFCKWNVGDPGRTTTAVGRWYSFHGKFIVTDKSAIALSANFTQTPELDTVIIFREDKEKIKEFNEKYEELLSRFVTKDDGYDGTIARTITSVAPADSSKIFELPNNVDQIHQNHWIRHYPTEICNSSPSIQEKLYITPFDCKGRDFFTNLIKAANEYVYISTESFTDVDFSSFLENTSINRNITIKMLSGARSMDFTDRMNNMFRDLLAQGIEIRTTDEEIHAKLIITDKYLAISSINLNKINLGFHVTKKYWRENTETILVCKNSEITDLAKKKYLEIFNQSRDVRDKLTEKLQGTVKDVFTGTFKLSSSSEVKKLFAKFILKQQINIRKTTIKVAQITKKLMKRFGRTKVEKTDFLSAIILYYLSERKQDREQLTEKIKEIEEHINIDAMLDQLKKTGLIEEEEGYYKINLKTLIS